MLRQNRWKFVLCRKAPYISEFLFMIVTRFSRSFLRIVRRFSIHILQLGFVNVFIAPIGFSCFTTTPRTYLRKYMTFKVVNQLNLIGEMKTITKPNCNLCMEERLTILKKLRDKRVTIMNKNSEIYGACRHKTTFHRFCLSTDGSVFNG